MATQPSVVLNLKTIDADWIHNFSRQFVNDEHKKKALDAMKDEKAYKDNKASIKEQGLLMPLIVREMHDGTGKGPRYRMVDGFRRYMMLTDLGKTEAPCVVVEADEKKADVLNVDLNIQRKTISSFGLATAAADMTKKHKVKSEDVGAAFHVSGGYVRQLKMFREGLPTEILIAWADRDALDNQTGEYKDEAVRAATTWDRLNEYTQLPDKKSQLAMFTFRLLKAQGKTDEEAKAAVEKEGFKYDPLATPARTRGGKSAKHVSIPVAEIKKMADAIATKDHPEPDNDLYRGALAVLQYFCKGGKQSGFKTGKALKIGKVELYSPVARNTGADVTN